MTDEDRSQVIVTLQGSMQDIVRALACALAADLVFSIRKVAPCSQEDYDLCPLAALVDSDHPSRPPDVNRLKNLARPA